MSRSTIRYLHDARGVDRSCLTFGAAAEWFRAGIGDREHARAPRPSGAAHEPVAFAAGAGGEPVARSGSEPLNRRYFADQRRTHARTSGPARLVTESTELRTSPRWGAPAAMGWATSGLTSALRETDHTGAPNLEQHEHAALHQPERRDVPARARGDEGRVSHSRLEQPAFDAVSHRVGQRPPASGLR
jgi:hypothetical protein